MPVFDLEKQIKDLIAANAAEYQRGMNNAFREGMGGLAISATRGPIRAFPYSTEQP